MAGVRPGLGATRTADFIVSIFMERLYGTPRRDGSSRLLVLWTAFGSVFALLLGYSRIPYAAALDGIFFRVGPSSPRRSRGRLHDEGRIDGVIRRGRNGVDPAKGPA